MKEFIKILMKITFYLPFILIIFQTFSIINAMFNGSVVGLFTASHTIYGIEAVMNTWIWIGFQGVIYIPFIIYQLIYVKLINKKILKKIFIIQLILMLILEAPLLYELIVHGF